VSSPAVAIPPVLGAVSGQDRAVAALAAAARSPVHAYLLLGPPGAGKRDTAVAFAAALLCPNGGCGTCETCRRVLGGVHPDVVVRERTGASITVGEAREVVRLSARSPSEAARKVLILTELHLVGPAAPALLKTIEEPVPGTVFVLTAETVSPEMVTIASRCVRVDLAPRTAEAPEAEAWRRAWTEVPARVDGTGATVALLAAELLEGCESTLEPLRRRQAGELAAATARAKELGERGAGLRDLEERHRRQQRRIRTDELKAGLAALAAEYRNRMVAARSEGEVRAAAAAVAAVDEAGRELVRNPNESLMLQALLVRLGRAE
jgi:DNA polymerase-3 subunit delta'